MKKSYCCPKMDILKQDHCDIIMTSNYFSIDGYLDDDWE